MTCWCRPRARACRCDGVRGSVHCMAAAWCVGRGWEPQLARAFCSKPNLASVRLARRQVWTHGELLPAHGYPALKKRFPHLVRAARAGAGRAPCLPACPPAALRAPAGRSPGMPHGPAHLQAPPPTLSPPHRHRSATLAAPGTRSSASLPSSRAPSWCVGVGLMWAAWAAWACWSVAVANARGPTPPCSRAPPPWLLPWLPTPLQMTTNCIQEPKKTYADRIWTTGEVRWLCGRTPAGQVWVVQRRRRQRCGSARLRA